MHATMQLIEQANMIDNLQWQVTQLMNQEASMTQQLQRMQSLLEAQE